MASRGETFSLAPHQSLTYGTRRRLPIYLGVYGPMGAELAGRVADGVRAAAQWDSSLDDPVPGLAVGGGRAGRVVIRIPST